MTKQALKKRTNSLQQHDLIKINVVVKIKVVSTKVFFKGIIIIIGFLYHHHLSGRRVITGPPMMQDIGRRDLRIAFAD